MLFKSCVAGWFIPFKVIPKLTTKYLQLGHFAVCLLHSYQDGDSDNYLTG